MEGPTCSLLETGCWKRCKLMSLLGGGKGWLGVKNEEVAEGLVKGRKSLRVAGVGGRRGQ